MLNFSPDRDFIGFRYISMYGLVKRKFRSKVTNNGRIALQIGFNCSYVAPIAQNDEKVLVRMLNFRPDRLL